MLPRPDQNASTGLFSASGPLHLLGSPLQVSAWAPPPFPSSLLLLTQQPATPDSALSSSWAARVPGPGGLVPTSLATVPCGTVTGNR